MDDEELRARGPAGLDPERREALRASVLGAIDHDEELRDAGPEGLAADRREALRASVLAGLDPAGAPATSGDDLPVPARGDDGDPTAAAPPPADGRRRAALVRTAAIVAAIAAVAAVALALAGGDGPEPVDTGPAAPTSEVPSVDLRGIDLDLDAERVTCIASDLPDARRFDLYASSTANTGAITEDAIREICQTDLEGADGTRKLGFEICRDPAVAFPQPIQLLGGGFCEDRDLVSFTADDLRVLNAARQDEAALLLAVADLGTCPGGDQVAATAAAVLTERDGDLELEVVDEGPADACWRVAVSWVEGTATVAPAP